MQLTSAAGSALKLWLRTAVRAASGPAPATTPSQPRPPLPQPQAGPPIRRPQLALAPLRGRPAQTRPQRRAAGPTQNTGPPIRPRPAGPATHITRNAAHSTQHTAHCKSHPQAAPRRLQPAACSPAKLTPLRPLRTPAHSAGAPPQSPCCPALPCPAPPCPALPCPAPPCPALPCPALNQDNKTTTT